MQDTIATRLTIVALFASLLATAPASAGLKGDAKRAARQAAAAFLAESRHRIGCPKVYPGDKGETGAGVAATEAASMEDLLARLREKPGYLRFCTIEAANATGTRQGFEPSTVAWLPLGEAAPASFQITATASKVARKSAVVGSARVETGLYSHAWVDTYQSYGFDKSETAAMPINGYRRPILALYSAKPTPEEARKTGSNYVSVHTARRACAIALRDTAAVRAIVQQDLEDRRNSFKESLNYVRITYATPDTDRYIVETGMRLPVELPPFNSFGEFRAYAAGQKRPCQTDACVIATLYQRQHRARFEFVLKDPKTAWALKEMPAIVAESDIGPLAGDGWLAEVATKLRLAAQSTPTSPPLEEQFRGKSLISWSACYHYWPQTYEKKVRELIAAEMRNGA
jgi:hypothetical protein